MVGPGGPLCVRWEKKNREKEKKIYIYSHMKQLDLLFIKWQKGKEYQITSPSGQKAYTIVRAQN